MRLFIAEKPSLAQAIANGLGAGQKSNGCIEIGSDTVTWCFGHIMQQYEPDEYNENYKKWRMEDLPIVPSVWKLKVAKDSAAQFKIIKELVAKADEIVNAGDPDREGQLLVDEVLEQLGNRKPVKRILLNALDEKSVKQALNNLRDNKDFQGLKNSALGRSRADWLLGMNLSRAYTLRARQAGYENTAISVGRVQTPTMALVVRREAEIENFKPVNYFTVQGIFKHGEEKFSAAWQMPDDLSGLDGEGRLVDRAATDSLLQKLGGLPTSQGKIYAVQKSEKQEPQRLTYSLADLQVEAGKIYGYSPQQVLDTMQDLYEKRKLTSYPRSDCAYLPENQLADVETILGNLAACGSAQIGELAQNADTSIRSRVWNDKKISAHHAIIPTRNKADFFCAVRY